MKRKVLSLLLLVFLISLSFLESKEVNASTLRLEHAPNVYYIRKGGNLPYASNPHPLYYMDGHVGYCIEPGKEIYSFEYSGTLLE